MRSRARDARRLLRALARRGPRVLDRAARRLVGALATRDQSGAIPYRVRGGTLEVLLVTSRRSGAWIVPKGNVPWRHSARTSAAKEAREEAGVEGDLTPESVGCYAYSRLGERRVVAVYDLCVTREHADWLERGERERRWFGLADAADAVDSRALRALILALPDRRGR